MGISGIDVGLGCTDVSVDDAPAGVRRRMVVADGSRVGKVTLAHVCPPERVVVPVTHSGATRESLAALEAARGEVVVL
jgi:hypothetical protein